MENKKQKDILKSIVEMNGIIDSFIGESQKSTKEKYKGYDNTELADAITRKAKSITSDLKGRLSAFKPIDVEEPETTSSTHTSALFKEVGKSNNFTLEFRGIQEIEDGSGSSATFDFQSKIQKFKIKSYGGGNGDFVKAVAEGGIANGKYFLISFSRKAVRNDEVAGKISWCVNNSCNRRGSSTEYTARINW